MKLASLPLQGVCDRFFQVLTPFFLLQKPLSEKEKPITLYSPPVYWHISATFFPICVVHIVYLFHWEQIDDKDKKINENDI